MGTRSITKVFTVDEQPIITMYGHFDGYPDGFGKALAKFVASKKLVNGINLKEDSSTLANGMPCLAAQIVANFKVVDEPGNFYLYPHGDADRCGAEYFYEVRATSLKCFDINGELLYDGPAAEFNVNEEI